MFERIGSLAKAQSAIGSMRQAIMSRLDADGRGLPALGGTVAGDRKPPAPALDSAADVPPAGRATDVGSTGPRHPVPVAAAPTEPVGAPGPKRGVASEPTDRVFTYRSRLDRRALERSRPRDRDDLLEFEALMEFAITRGVRRQAVDLSYLDTPVSIELTAMLPSFGKALRELRRFAQDHGWPTVTVAYGDDEGPVSRVMSPGSLDPR